MYYADSQAVLPVTTNSAVHRIFDVVVRTRRLTLRFQATALGSVDVHLATIDRYGACGVTVTPA